MDDLLYINKFIKTVIDRKKECIVGVAVTGGNRLNLPKDEPRFKYLLSLLFIMGFSSFVAHMFEVLYLKIKDILAKAFFFIPSPSLLDYAKIRAIPAYYANSANDEKVIRILQDLKPDVIINQSQDILSEEFLSIPKVGVLNRHNGLLPKNRGRLSPFWCLYRSEKEAGVSIHFVNRKIDGGDILVQKRFPVGKKESFSSLVEKCYRIAPEAMEEALDLLEKGSYTLIANREDEATTNTIPSLKEAFLYRSRLHKASA